MRSVIAVYVENKYGVLTRVSGLFMRRGFNIDSLTVGATDNPGFSRITVVIDGDARVREQLVTQLKKLHNVKEVKILDGECSVERELMLIKMKNSPETRGEIMAAADVYRAKIIDYSTETMCVEITGETTKLNAFLEVLKPHGIVEICRTGIVALERKKSLLA